MRSEGHHGRARDAASAAAARAGAHPRTLPRLLTVVAACVLTPLAAAAQEADTPDLAVHAFGTLGVVHSTEDEADFVWNPARPDGPGASEDLSVDVDSRIGGQVTAYLTPELTAVVQVVAEQRSDDTYTPQVEWANVRWDVTPDLSVRLGRTALSAFMVSEARKISYVNPWIRPPVEVYGQVPVTSVDGVDASYREHFGDWTNTLHVSFGRSESDAPDGSSIEAERAWNVNNTIQRGGFTGRVAFARGYLTIEAFRSLFEGFRAFGPEGEAVADRFEVDDTPFEFATIGAEYDPGSWFGMAELGWTDFNSVLGERLGGYATAGRRFGAITPYLTYSRAEVLSDLSVQGLSLEGLPPGPAGAAAGLNAGLDALLDAAPVQQNLSLGGRWDVARGVAVKAQVDFIDMLEDSPGTFINRQPGFEPGGDAQLFSLATTFVF